jgi:hypothetical protein
VAGAAQNFLIDILVVRSGFTVRFSRGVEDVDSGGRGSKKR